MANAYGRGDYATLELNFKNTGMDLWYNMHELALLAMRDSVEAKVAAVVDEYEENWTTFETEYSEFTQALHELYAARYSRGYLGE